MKWQFGDLELAGDRRTNSDDLSGEDQGSLGELSVASTLAPVLGSVIKVAPEHLRHRTVGETESV